jgi:hypothetical protein
LSDFQKEVPILFQNAKGHRYNYVDLAEIIRVITPYLQKHDLGFSQPLEDNGKIRTIIFHVPTGQKIESSVRMPQGVQMNGMNDFQVYGSAISYFRRYSLVSILGLVSDKDLDAAGEQLKKEVFEIKQPTIEKPTLTDSRFKSAIIAIQNDEFSKEELINKFSLTKEQTEFVKLLNV